jgi:hypothetical protein
MGRVIDYLHAEVTIGGTTGQILAASPDRHYVRITNTHATQVLYLMLGADAELGKGIYLKAGESYVMSHGLDNLSFQAINGIASGAGTTVQVVHG